MESKLMFLVVCMIGCAVSCIKADGHLSPPTNLTSNITNNECGKTKLCLDKPKGCDPSGSSQCFFTSVTLTNISIKVELSGNSTGYIALAAGVTSNVSQDRNIIFVCGNNGSFFFRTTTLFNNTLQITNILNVINIQGSIQSSLIRCVFSIPIYENITSFLSYVNGSNFTTSNIANSYIPVFLDIWKGSANGTVLGTPTSVLESPVLVNLANVNSTNVVSTTASTPASTTTTTTTKTTAHSNASITLTSLLSHAAVCFLSIFLNLI
ncbi:putative ferric-chelate reductase 1 [Chanodichthys erythropterus]|uniref:putative ferric-chelate reductase 1 n=1 Tax=Chanodichthys erythropterus TaxID=933992 RepID=UPI00351E9888